MKDWDDFDDFDDDGFEDGEVGVEVVVRVKKGCKLSFDGNTPWLPMSWVKGDLVALAVDDSSLSELLGIR